MRTAIVSTLLAVAASTLPGAEPATLVSPLKNQSAIEGCAWSASAPALGDGFIYLEDLADPLILMNIDGVDTEFALVRQQGLLASVGDIMIRSFRAANVTVEAQYKVTWVCPPESESCEVTKYSVTFTVTRGTRTQVVEAAGYVGC